MNTSINSMEPKEDAYEGLTSTGKYKITEISYGQKYPNSYLDILYTGKEPDENKPTLIYIHGGGFFFGSKNTGDPIAGKDSSDYIELLCDAGFNLVIMDYAMVPEYHFPTPLYQLNEVLRFLKENAEKYHLNMEDVVIGGQSAGAIMTAQYAAAVADEGYAQTLGISEPAIDIKNLKAVYIDDAPLDYGNFNLATKIIIGNYGSIIFRVG